MSRVPSALFVLCLGGCADPREGLVPWDDIKLWAGIIAFCALMAVAVTVWVLALRARRDPAAEDDAERLPGDW